MRWSNSHRNSESDGRLWIIAKWILLETVSLCKGETVQTKFLTSAKCPVAVVLSMFASEFYHTTLLPSYLTMRGVIRGVLTGYLEQVTPANYCLCIGMLFIPTMLKKSTWLLCSRPYDTS